MSNTPEGKIKRKLDRVLKQEGVWFFNPQAGPFGRAGIPDKIACIGGKFVGIECKADKTKKPTPLQIKAMKEIEWRAEIRPPAHQETKSRRFSVP